VCPLCRRNVYSFYAARSYAAYDDVLVHAVTLLKYEGVRPLAAWFAARLEEVCRAEPEALAADLVVPVPMHPDRQRERGHNQAELLSRALARGLRLPHEPHALERIKPRPAKLKLSRHERWSAARGAYAAAREARIDKRRVLLVDDVFTTGATLDSCSRALMAAGAGRVAAVTVARVVDAWAGGAP
jgi:ComF family protein